MFNVFRSLHMKLSLILLLLITSLMAVVESEEEAMEIAEKYMIEFVSFQNRMALFQTEEDPYAVIRRGEENDYPPLSVNYVRTIDGVIEE